MLNNSDFSEAKFVLLSKKNKEPNSPKNLRLKSLFLFYIIFVIIIKFIPLTQYIKYPPVLIGIVNKSFVHEHVSYTWKKHSAVFGLIA